MTLKQNTGNRSPRRGVQQKNLQNASFAEKLSGSVSMAGRKTGTSAGNAPGSRRSNTWRECRVSDWGFEMTMTVGSLFSGCGGFDIGFKQAGFKTIWACEIDRQARAVFRRHFPDAELYYDITELNGATLAPVDVLIFGSPCQDLSVAGKRAGLAGARSGLFMEAMRIVDDMAPENRPRVAVWENVPGALSSHGGRDFGTVLGEMGKRWGGIAYRVLDLQYFGPPQRRRRVFVVGHSGGWRSAGEILFEPEGMRWNPPPRREKGSNITSAITRSFGTGGADDVKAQAGLYMPEISPCLRG